MKKKNSARDLRILSNHAMQSKFISSFQTRQILLLVEEEDSSPTNACNCNILLHHVCIKGYYRASPAEFVKGVPNVLGSSPFDL
jgi:hypothetical protein